MQYKGKKYFRILVTSALMCMLFTQARAVNDPIQTRPLLGSKDSVKVGYTSSVIDFAQYVQNRDTSIKPRIMAGSTHIQNRVSVGIEEDNPLYIQTDFTATVVLHIKRYDSSFTLVDEFDSSFTVNYAMKAAGAKYNAMQTMLFENAYQTDVSIVSIDTHGTTSWDVAKVLRIDNTLQASRDYVFTCSTPVPGLQVTKDNVNGELTAQWSDPGNGQTEYDLEWAWIDLSALPPTLTEENIFTNNSTRVTITGTTYNIPLFYEGQGTLFVRVRPAQMRNTGQRVEGEWTWQDAGGTAVQYSFDGHRGDLNWQASTSFAEDGKRKTVLHYSDGTLRSRQTVTKDNTTGTTVVAESMYDYQGRPVIQVLPAPTLDRIITYAQNFNKAVNYNGYPKDLYDLVNTGQNICGISAAQMDNTSGAAKYYSPNNEDLNNPATGYNPAKFIPDAQQYPFTETRMTPDGRIAAQGGVGPDHQLGSGHETKYLYDGPSQPDMDALFGTDAGVSSHYFRTYVKDANGQYSVSYTDMHGRTVATALAGAAPLNVTALASQNTRTTTRQLLDDETNRVNGRSITSSKPLAILSDDNYTFKYTLDPDQLLTTNCQNNTVCYDCLYDLKITITSDCNTAGFPVTYTYNNFSLNQNLGNPTCNNGKTPGKFDVTLPQTWMPQGQYTITKELTLSRTAQDAYRVVYATNNTCRTFADIYNQIYNVLVAQSNCATNCDQCNASLGTPAQFRANFITESGWTGPISPEMDVQITAAYNNAKAHCDRLCNNTNDGMDLVRSIKKQMLVDVSPGGQYAKTDQIADRFNIFNTGTAQQTWTEIFNVGKAGYQHPVNYIFGNGTLTDQKYHDQFGNALDAITIPAAPNTTSPELFAQDFVPSYAEQLLPHHPEYGKLKAAMEKLPASYQFEAKLNSLKTWADMINAVPGSSGRYVQHILEEDPFFAGGAPSAPGAAYYQQMHDWLDHYYNLDPLPATAPQGCTPPGQGTTGYGWASLWKIAQSLVFCRNSSNTNNGCLGSDQMICIFNTPAIPAVNPTHGCAQDWDKVWQLFSSIYLNQRAIYIAQYLQSQNTVTDQLITQDVTHQLRFVDPSAASVSGAGGVTTNNPDLAHLFNEAAAGDQHAVQTGTGMYSTIYAETCEAYASTWITQLSQCDIIRSRWTNPTTKTTDLAWLLPRLRDICEHGSDQDHPMGSSSINPNQPDNTVYHFADFPAVIQQFFHDNNITPPLTANCNNYLITVPKPYDRQQQLTTEQIVTTPSQCDCDEIHAMYAQYINSHFPGTFSVYLHVNYQTDISDADLNTLLNLCSPAPTCVFLVTPINLPPVLQCQHNGSPIPPAGSGACINCTQYAQIKTDFYNLYNTAAPIANPQTQADRDWNAAFQNYANYQTGFSKTWQEYLDFGTQCDNVQEIPCTALNTALTAFYLSPEYQQTPIGGSCITAFVNFFNNYFHVYRSYEDWMQAFSVCGPVPDPCGPRLTCQKIEDGINAFYDTYGFNVHSNANCQQIFVAFMDERLGGNFTYQQIETFYHFLCNTQCSLDVCSFPNCFLMTRVYNAYKDANDGHPWTLPDCRGSFVDFFNNYFGLDPAWEESDIEAAFAQCSGAIFDGHNSCAPDLNSLCTPDLSCPSLQYIVELWHETYPDGNVPDCQNTFTAFFNQIMQSNYDWTDIVKFYLHYCGAEPDVCTVDIDCGKLIDFVSWFAGQMKPDDVNCQTYFVETFNEHFGTSYTSYIQIYNLYKGHCDFLLKNCGAPYPEMNCDNLKACLVSFEALYPDPPSQLGTDCQQTFRNYFNSWFGPGDGITPHTFTEIMDIYNKQCGEILSVCGDGAESKMAFNSEFTTRYGGMQVNRKVRRQMYTYLYNKKFINDKSRTANRKNIAKTADNRLAKPQTNAKDAATGVIVSDYSKLETTVMPADMISAIESTPDSVSISYNSLLDMKQAYYVLNPKGVPADCLEDFTSWFNITMNTKYDVKTLQNLYNTVVGTGAGDICGKTEVKELVADEIPAGPFPVYQPPLLCGLNTPVLHDLPVNNNPCAGLDQIAYNEAMIQWQLYTESIKNDFDLKYYDKCMKAKDMESLTITGGQSEYHYTLYYYDQAGNLVRTVPPAGVDDKHGNTSFLTDVKTARDNDDGTVVVPNHILTTEYRYNTLNQVVAQRTPDAQESYFYYDRLGRLTVSQNKKQAANSNYSYTLYDELGRITEVGQLNSSTAITQAISQNGADENTTGSLLNWLNNKSSEQITRTFYDKSYFDGSSTLCPQYLCQQNLRNRVSYTAVFTSGTVHAVPGYLPPAGTHTTATFYSYDIHGNVDNLLQDYNFGDMVSSGNRFKKMHYDYDLISSKVNEVAYQAGAPDAFYHKYSYDAENRLTDVETSTDHVVWEKDARYNYYKHGPLARVILGQEQVQGVDYAYTLQGWLKGINSTAVGDGSIDMGGDGIVSGTVLNPVARDVFGLSLNYYANDYNAIGSNSTPFTNLVTTLGSNASGLYNGSIAAMSVNIPVLGEAKIYSFKYDQLNRLLNQDVFEGLNNTTNAFNPISLDSYKEMLSYDANGNILTYTRNGQGTGAAAPMNNYSYSYTAGTNRLQTITNSVNTQTKTYGYDEIGNTTSDGMQGAGSIIWNVYGKVQSLVNKDGAAVNYSYDASGQRISKTVGTATEYYVKDATGNLIATYKKETGLNSGHLSTREFYKYGSSLLDIKNVTVDVEGGSNASVLVRGNDGYILSDARNNTLAVISDKKIQHTTSGTTVDYYTAEVKTANYYSSYGAVAKSFGQPPVTAFNGQRKSTEIGDDAQTAFFWEYNGDVGRRWNIDPLANIWESSYSCFLDNPILVTDVLGNQASSGDDPGKPQTVIVLISKKVWPNVYKTTEKAFAQGKPSILTYDPSRQNARQRRRAALAGYPPAKPGFDRDEYPYASTMEGGTGAVVNNVPSGENRSHGQYIGALVKMNKMKKGDKFLVVLWNDEDEKERSPATQTSKAPATVPVSSATTAPMPITIPTDREIETKRVPEIETPSIFQKLGRLTLFGIAIEAAVNTVFSDDKMSPDKTRYAL